jgi:Leucine-rich repeat (LRR) protein
MDSNELSGSIPSEMGLLSLMTELKLHTNNLTGPILPDFVQQFMELEQLALERNSFTGTLPSFGPLTKLTEFKVGAALITGTIPSSIALLTSLVDLKLQNNTLTGTIPTVLHTLSNLGELWLFGNNFSGSFTCPLNVADCYVSCHIPGNASCRVFPP